MTDHVPLWTSEELAVATDGSCKTDWQATGVSIDSRTLDAGDLFVALAGPTHDGHRFVAQALAQGAAGAMVDASEAAMADLLPHQDRLLVVDDTTRALENLARVARRRTDAKIIGVTGSVGKTGTKEMLKLVLSGQGPTAATKGNLNNHFGLPLSLARMPQQAAFGVFEMGMSSPGEIEPLSKMARPHVALITAIEPAHSEFFNSIEEIADAKAEIFKGLEAGGTAILNADNPMFEHLRMRAAQAGVVDIRTFGSGAEADCALMEVKSGATASQATVNLRGRSIRFDLPVPGRHWVQNAMAVLCAVDALGADAAAAAESLKDMAGLEGRGRLHTLSISGGSFTLIDESYNASPASMKAAIEVLGQAPVGEGGRRIAVLGDMLELGDMAPTLHENLVEDLVGSGIDLVFTTGQHMACLASVLPAAMRGGHAHAAAALSPLLRSVIRPGDVLTVKGSLGSRTAVVVEDLLKLEWAPGQGPASDRVVNGG